MTQSDVPLTMNRMNGRDTFAVRNSPSRVCKCHELQTRTAYKRDLTMDRTAIERAGSGVSPGARVSGGAAVAGSVSDATLGARAPMGSNVEYRLSGGARSASLIARGRERRDMSQGHPPLNSLLGAYL